MKKDGFTLVELLAVIVVLAIVMGLAVFSMRGATAPHILLHTP